MFRQTVAGRQVRITVADLAANDIAKRLELLGVNAARIQVVDDKSGTSPVAEFVQQWVSRIGTDFNNCLPRSGVADAPMMVCWSPEHCATVLAVEGSEDGHVLLRLGVPRHPAMLGRDEGSRGEILPGLPTLQDVARSAGPIVAQLADGSAQTVLGVSTATGQAGYTLWNALYTSGPLEEQADSEADS